MTTARFLLLSASLVLAFGCNEVVVPAEEGCLLDGDCPSPEICRDGTCVTAQLPPVPDGGIANDCTPESEGEFCGVGAFCNDEGRCATLPSCADGCPDGFICNTGLNRCVRETACGGSCPNGDFCDGVEVCDSATGNCLPGTPPCAADRPVCDEAQNACLCGDDLDCGLNETCDNGQCSCTRDCDGKDCGSDGCGGTCGTCEGAGDVCTDGVCECTPDCSGRECGSDGCGGFCTPGCLLAGDSCNTAGQCVCTPDCSGRECGDNGCGGSCAPGCTAPAVCSLNGICDCTPDCNGKVCGPDGCGGTCAPGCTGGDVCSPQGQCDCTPDCTGAECGNDGCGGVCGVCHPSQQCAVDDCVNTGVICDALTDLLGLDERDASTGALTLGVDQEYEFDGEPFRVIDDYDLTVPGPDGDPAIVSAPLAVTLTSTAFTPQLYIFRLDGGQCTMVGRTLSTADTVQLSGTLDPAGTYKAVITSHEPLVGGSYQIFSDPVICNKIFDAQATYDKCVTRIRQNNFTCANNPCVDFGVSSEFCCVNQNPAAGCDPNFIELGNDPNGCGL